MNALSAFEQVVFEKAHHLNDSKLNLFRHSDLEIGDNNSCIQGFACSLLMGAACLSL